MSQEPNAPPAPPPVSRFRDPTPYVLGGFAVFTFLWFRVYLSSEPVAAVDLPGHLQAMRGYLTNWNWWKLSPAFYDVSCFTGYPAFQFYAFLPHLAAALLSVPLSLVADDPVRLSAHVMVVAALALLPWSMMKGVQPLVEEIWGDQVDNVRRNRWVLAVVACTFSFWFTNHDYQWYGIGAGAVLNIGLFSQAFAWHFMMLHLGALLVFLRDGGTRNRDKVALWFALLFLTHTMTAVFSAFIALLAILWFNASRWELVKAHLLAFVLVGFWVVPMVVLMSPYTGLDIHRPTGDFLEIFLRYPLYAMFRSMGNWLQGYFEPLSPVEMLIMALLALFLVSKESKRCRMLVAFMAFGAVGVVFLTSGYTATSVRFGFHWYRFVAYLLFYLAALLCALPFLLLKQAESLPSTTPWPKVAKLAVVAAFAGSFTATAFLPHNERAKIIRSRTPEFLANEDAVLDYFRSLPMKGRVITEYFSNYDKFPFLSCHVISTRMLQETGFEPINGLFVQASLSYHLPMGSANQLKANSYNGPLLYPAVTDLTDDAKFDQLKEYGITHVIGIVGSEFTTNIRKRAVGPSKVIGPYEIMQILPETAPMATTVSKRVAAYLDAKGTLPYKFMELYFYAKQQLSPNWELMELKNGDALPPQVELVIINGSPTRVRTESDRLLSGLNPAPTVLSVDYEQHYLTRHYSVQYQHNQELDDFQDTGNYLDKKANLVAQVAGLPPSPLEKLPYKVAQMAWDRDKQAFTLDGLEPGRLYRINYSYFPFWRSGDGRVLRGSEERIFFVPEETRARFSWAPYRSGSVILGWLMTLAGVWFFWRNWKRKPATAAP